MECEPANPRRGLTFRDLDVGTYGFTEMPELIRDNRSFAPRGAEIPRGLPGPAGRGEPQERGVGVQHRGLLRGGDDAAVERHHRRPLGGARGKYELPEEIGKAYSQLLTFLTEVEMIATDVPAKWLGRLNADFFEVKSFIATQAMDEARHAEVFRKRALTTGWGLMRASLRQRAQPQVPARRR